MTEWGKATDCFQHNSIDKYQGTISKLMWCYNTIDFWMKCFRFVFLNALYILAGYKWPTAILFVENVGSIMTGDPKIYRLKSTDKVFSLLFTNFLLTFGSLWFLINDKKSYKIWRSLFELMVYNICICTKYTIFQFW